jgi:hypothetical protein
VERRYSSYSFLTSVLDGGDWPASRPDRALGPGKGPLVPTVQEAGWAPEPVCTHRLQEKSFRLCQGSNLDRPDVQPVARHYTDSATRLTHTFPLGCQMATLQIKLQYRCKSQQTAGLSYRQYLHNANPQTFRFACVCSLANILSPQPT